ncbi:MAG: hypothetical protein H6916_14100 [Novosphingobium sp.]|uniref:hypothetical protein n=1 Tax=Novosphingobium sp. TaxID=1874826 RepID=UPI001DBDE505|nr:hypothetical protein [Novosphingobium sp.]MCB2057081.1 hypothetical protein [Novosphingobium sp.]MCP5387923.1 hypothetical protein [Novosphingobium sp.]
MIRRLFFVMAVPFLVGAHKADEQAVISVLSSISAGDVLPEEILDRQVGYDFPDLDQSLARAKGCTVGVLDPLQTGNYAVQWRCKGRKRKEMPSALILYVKDGKVTKITTAVLM